MATGKAVIKIECATQDASDLELRSLAKWLRGEDAFRGRVGVEQKPIEPGQMGGVLDSVAVILSSGSAAAFSTSLFSWLGRRTEAAKVSLQLKNDNTGEELVLSCGNAADAQEILAKAQHFFEAKA